MVSDNYHRDRIANRRLHPETLMMGYGYAPGLSEGSLKPPIFLTSTFVFETAQQGKDFFDLTSGRRQPRPGEKSGLVYSRFNNPNLEILEDRNGRGSTLVTSQVPAEQWCDVIGDPTLADAILDRLVHNAHRLTMTGESMRRITGRRALDADQNP